MRKVVGGKVGKLSAEMLVGGAFEPPSPRGNDMIWLPLWKTGHGGCGKGRGTAWKLVVQARDDTGFLDQDGSKESLRNLSS